MVIIPQVGAISPIIHLGHLALHELLRRQSPDVRPLRHRRERCEGTDVPNQDPSQQLAAIRPHLLSESWKAPSGVKTSFL